MKVRLIRLLGAVAIGILLTAMVASCMHKKAQQWRSNPENISQAPPPPPPSRPAPVPTPSNHSTSKNATKDNNWEKLDYRHPAPTEKAPASSQLSSDPVNRDAPKAVVKEIVEVEEEVAEDDFKGYDDSAIEDIPEPPRQEAEAKIDALKKQAGISTGGSATEISTGKAENEALAKLEVQRLKAEESRRAREQGEFARQKAKERENRLRLEREMQRKMAELERQRKEQERLQNQLIEPVGREDYAHIDENDFTSPLSEPLSTFSIDVDKAAYANTRRYLNSGSLPPAGAVRIEELINYFHYDYRQPFSSQPFAFNTETSSCPWNSDHQLVHIGLKGREIDRSEMPASNLVFLIDVSGSMNSANKLPLLKQAFNLLINNLNKRDRVAIVVYAGAAGVVLPSTTADQKGKIMDALDNLSAGGSTAGGAGIQLAYQIARNHLMDGCNNRVILATDGDFNVGPSSESALIELIESKRKEGVFLSVLGFGTGNYQDRRMEQLADHGNGNYAYIDNLQEAEKVLVQEMGGTLHAIAKDVKIQIEFNPTYVKAYRLIGYENRALAAQDFNDDTKDAGELGAGHTVTALYEIVPHSANTPVANIDPLKYQQITPSNLSTGAELMTLKFRYKEPNGDVSKLLTEAVKVSDKTLSATSDNYRFAASVAAFGMLLRNSRYSGDADYDMVMDMAKDALGRDAHGYRAEFLQLVKRARQIDNRRAITGN